MLGIHLTERIWLSAFGTLPKFSLTAGLQVRSEPLGDIVSR